MGTPLGDMLGSSSDDGDELAALRSRRTRRGGRAGGGIGDYAGDGSSGDEREGDSDADSPGMLQDYGSMYESATHDDADEEDEGAPHGLLLEQGDGCPCLHCQVHVPGFVRLR